MIAQKKRYGWLSLTLVILPLTAILSGCGGKAEAPATMPPATQQKAATDTQQGIAKETASKQAEAADQVRRKSAGTTH